MKKHLLYKKRTHLISCWRVGQPGCS